MPVINLFTDYRNDPLYGGRLMGYLRTRHSGDVVVSTHFLPYDNLMTSSFIVKNLYQGFDRGTVHLICTNTSSTRINQYLAAEYDGHYFVLADNGLIDLITGQSYGKLVAFDGKRSTFAELEIMAPVALKLASGASLAEIGREPDIYKHALALNPVSFTNKIQGTVIYIDSYGNAITNIDRGLFERVGKGRKYKVWVGLPMNFTTQVRETYRSSPGDFTAVFNSFGLLELGVVYGHLGDLLDLKENQAEVVVEFF